MTKSYKRVFLSWQSDLNQPTTTGALRKALKIALKDRKDWKSDEAARTSSGAPNIASTLEVQIENAEIFIADVSTVKKKLWGRRAFQNPNVLYELGFAVAHLGWERIILVSSSRKGDSHEELPFDLQKHRTTHFYLKSDGDKKGQESLNQVIKLAIAKIINKNPPKPSDKVKFKTIEARRLKDLQRLIELLELIDFHSVDKYIADSPTFIFFDYLDGGESAAFKIGSTVWTLHDKDILKDVERFIDQWGKTLSFGRRYESSINGPYHLFKNNYAYESPKEVKADSEAISEAVQGLFEAKEKLIQKLEIRYPEIDIEETSTTARRNWRAEHADILKSFNP